MKETFTSILFIRGEEIIKGTFVKWSTVCLACEQALRAALTAGREKKGRRACNYVSGI